jgi:hypothetical protein
MILANKESRPNREREGERMHSSSIDIFYATSQRKYQASLLHLDAERVFGRSVRYELNLPIE